MSDRHHRAQEPDYHGLRMSADEYLALDQTQDRYELIDGIVVMSPSPFPDHSEVATEIIGQLWHFERCGGKIRVFADIDVRLTSGKVYRPDIAVYSADRLRRKPAHLEKPADLIVEILSPGSRSLDLITKRKDYQRFGVREYWVVDPSDGRVRCWRLARALFVPAAAKGPTLPCAALPGFALDLAAIRRVARG